VAERLQALAAPSQALASETCQMLAVGYVQFGTGEMRGLKGFPQPVRVHPVKGIGELSKWRVNLARGTTAFVGRGGELSHLLSLADAATASKDCVMHQGPGSRRTIARRHRIRFQCGQNGGQGTSVLAGHRIGLALGFRFTEPGADGHQSPDLAI